MVYFEQNLDSPTKENRVQWTGSPTLSRSAILCVVYIVSCFFLLIIASTMILMGAYVFMEMATIFPPAILPSPTPWTR